MRAGRMARDRLTAADEEADQETHAHGDEHGLGGLFLHVFFTGFMKMLGLVADDHSLFLRVIADGARLFRGCLAYLVYFGRSESPGLVKSGNGHVAGGGAGAAGIRCCYGRFKFGLIVLHD